MILSELHLYPIKSCAGVSVHEIGLDRFGAVGDRRWMLVDASGKFITQRSDPRMCLIGARPLSGGGLQLAVDGATLEVRVPGPGAVHVKVRVWEDAVDARYASAGADQLLSEFLRSDCRLVYMPDESRRLVDTDYARDGQTVGFADGFPLLLISQESLDELNRRLAVPVPMNRFRPNLVVSGCEPFAEDRWRRIRIGEQILHVVKPCSRCVMPSIIQDSAERDSEILRTLAAFRRRDGVVYFGQNLLYESWGHLAVGDRVEILQEH